jgi:dethiobiotin synthetase
MKSRGYFIAGTDTGVGKTRVSCGLINGFRQLGSLAGGMKPVVAGSISDDLDNISAVSAYSPGFTSACSYLLDAPAAPFIAAEQAGKRIELTPIMADFARCLAEQPLTIVEGTGGWLCPINDRETMADVARAMGLPVVLVVGLRLGCLNHALLSAAAIRQAGLPLAGWVANAIDPAFADGPENVEFLARQLGAQPLATLPWMPLQKARELCLDQAARRLGGC